MPSKPVLHQETSLVTILFRNETIDCGTHELLRSALLRRGLTPHNGRARIINCRGLGTCGTCAVEILGAVEPAELSPRERARLALPPFSAAAAARLRLACQTRVVPQPSGAPLRIAKYDGFWGQAWPRPSADNGFALPLGRFEFLLDPAADVPAGEAAGADHNGKDGTDEGAQSMQ